MSSGPTDRARRGIALGLAAAALCALPGAPAARAGDDDPPEGPVVFRNPDPETARDISRCISLFGDPSPTNKEGARNRLYEIGWWSVARLLDTIQSRQGQFRINSYLVLGRLGDRRGIPAMRAEIAETTEWPPAVAALMLGRVKDAEDPTLASYAAALKSEAGNDLRRRAVCLALAKLHRRRADTCIPLLEDALASRTANPAVHHAALLALGFFRSRIVEALPDGTGFRPKKAILDALKDKDTGLRHSAILALSISYIDSFHPLFVEAFQKDGDHQVRLAALLALGRNRDPATTTLLAKVVDDPSGNAEERRMAAYLLGRRPEGVAKDPKAFESLYQAAGSNRSQELAAAALVALASVEDPRVANLLTSRLGASSATVRAAAAFGAVRLKGMDDLKRARDALSLRVKAGENDENAREDMRIAIAEINAILKDRADAAAGLVPAPRPAPKWKEVDGGDLFLELGRDERQRTFDFVNYRALQVLGIESLFAYRPVYDPDEPAESLGGGGVNRFSVHPGRPVNNQQSDQYDVRVELSRRPYFTPEQDDPDATPAPVPRETK